MIKTSSPIPNLLEKIFNRISRETENQLNPKLSDRDFLELHSILGKTFEEALNILDRNRIVVYRSNPTSFKSYREICEISSFSSSNPVTYKLFRDINYCKCLEFDIVLSGLTQQYTCKHVIALKLALLLKKIQLETLTNDQFKLFIKEIN